MKQLSKFAIATAAFAFSAIFTWSEQGGISLSIESAQARVGRPATPASVAGVARRQTRRGYYGAAAVGAAAVGTAAAVAATTYYGGAGYYAGGPYYQTPGYYAGTGYYAAPYNGYPAQGYVAPNGFVCQPGSMVRLDDGRMYPCQ
jgi:hypothetical protein